jgi:hypothetical protein
MKRMKKFHFALAVLALALLAPTAPARAEGGRDKDDGERDHEERGEHDRQRPVVPPILEPPADQKVIFHAFAVGVQIYVVTQNPTNPALYSWVFKAPEAVLFKDDDRDEPVGLHYAGPTWEHKDGSKVVGTVRQRSPSPDASAIPWLLLQAVSHEGCGHFRRVTYIQRVNTVGGIAPATGADAAHVGQEARVPYTADYYFYRARHPADEVIEWNQKMLHAALVANTSPLVTTRVGALVQSAVFDAVNGIERRYEPIHVPANAPRGASRRAAAVQASYAMLVKLFPTQKPDLDVQLAESLSAIACDTEDEGSDSILRGIQWGQAVADAIWAWRSTDGFTPAPPPFVGGSAVGQWRPTPPGLLPGAGPQFAYMTPWAINSPSQFRPAGPPALTSDRYTADFNEVKSMGSITSTLRTDDQTLLANFWNSSTVTYFWNTVAVSLATRHHASLSENARLLALLNIALADAAIACWEAKYTYVFWRPITAIALADTDGNPATEKDALWTPLLITPNHPEYPSGHSTTSGAAAALLAHYFGNQTSFTVDSDRMPGVTRSFTSLSAALDEIKDARIFGGIHFRSACDDGQATGIKVANFVLENSMQRIHGKGFGQFHR